MEGAEKEKKIPAVSQAFKSEGILQSCIQERSSQIKHLKEVCPKKKMLWKAKRKLTYKKVNHYYKEYRQMYRLRLEWLRWQESWQPLSTCETQIGICHQNQGYQRWAERAGKSCRFFAFVRSLIAQSLSSTRIMEPCIAWGHQNLKSLKNWSTNVSYGKIYKKWGLPW